MDPLKGGVDHQEPLEGADASDRRETSSKFISVFH